MGWENTSLRRLSLSSSYLNVFVELVGIIRSFLSFHCPPPPEQISTNPPERRLSPSFQPFVRDSFFRTVGERDLPLKDSCRRDQPVSPCVRPFPERGRMLSVPFILLLAYVVCLSDGESYPGSELDIPSVSENSQHGDRTPLLC